MEALVKNGVPVEKVLSYFKSKGVERLDAQKRLYYLKKKKGVITFKSNGTIFFPENIFKIINELKNTGPKTKRNKTEKLIQENKTDIFNYLSEDVRAIIRINAKKQNTTVNKIILDIINNRVKEAMESIDLV